MLGRRPYYEQSNGCAHESVDEIGQIFPEWGRRIRFIEGNSSGKLSMVSWGGYCCNDADVRFNDPEPLRKYADSKFLQVSGDHLQSYRYFLPYNSEILRILSFSPAIEATMEQHRQRIFGMDTHTHKLCVHTRTGDFSINHWITSLPFTEAATNFAASYLRSAGLVNTELALVLLGEDKAFLKNVTYDASLFSVLYSMPAMSRGEDMCFCARHCNSLLITAPSSTFAWWIGYFMSQSYNTPDGKGKIFYNSDFKTYAPYTHDNYPSEWIPLRLQQKKRKGKKNEGSGVVKIE